MLPSVGCTARRMQRDVVVFPQPDSPTRDKVSPRAIEKVTVVGSREVIADAIRRPIRRATGLASRLG